MLKRSISICLFVAFCLGTGLVYAFDAAQLQTFKSTKVCANCDLSFVNLAQTSLYRSNVSNTNFSLAVITRCDAGYAYAVNANFYGANLAEGKFLGANLTGANLSGANLYRSYLGSAILEGANLSNANLARAYLNGANLTGANLTGANLSGATWIDGAICKTPSTGTCVK